MISQNDLRNRQSKKKIFFDQAIRNKQEIKTPRDNNNKVVQSDIVRPGNIVQQLKKQVQQLQSNNNELKKLLRQERERYDKLFQQYEDLTEKNSVIEKEYINLKYEHNKEIKELKKSISSIITEKITKAFEDFEVSLKEEKVVQSFKSKLDKYFQKINELPRLTQKFKMKRANKKGSQIYEFIEQRPNVSHLSQRSQLHQKRLEFFQQEQNMAKINSSPEQEKSLKSIKSQSDVSNRQTFVFEDEYYGEIEDFAQYEQKIIQRRNYELMRRNSRTSNEIKRKKIFQQQA